MRIRLTLASMMACCSALSAQEVVSAHSGLIHFVDGYGATLGGLLVSPKLGEFPLMRDGETLVTEHARVEVLLNPGVFLRMDENSSFKMVTGKLSDTRVEILTGSAIVEVDDLQKGNNVMLLFHDAKITPTRHGLYRLDADQRRFRVSEGEAQVIQGSQTVEVRAGRQVEFGAVLASSKFNRKATDSLDTWAAARSQRIAQANVTSANMVGRGGRSAYTNSSWVWNPYFGLLTYLPARGYGYSPYGWRIYSPYTVDNYNRPSYQPPSNSTYSASSGSGGYRGSISSGPMSNGSVVSSNPSVAAAPAPAAPAAAAPMSRGSVSSNGGGAGR